LKIIAQKETVCNKEKTKAGQESQKVTEREDRKKQDRDSSTLRQKTIVFLPAASNCEDRLPPDLKNAGAINGLL
jgi:hypothetical protein